MAVIVPASGPDSFEMSSYYHVECFALPRKLKHLGAEEFLKEYVTDTSEDQSILTDLGKIAQAIEQASGGKKVKKEEEQENETFMDRVARVAKQELKANDDDEQPAKKKAKKEIDDEFRQMVDLYKEHYKKKIDDLKDYLR